MPLCSKADACKGGELQRTRMPPLCMPLYSKMDALRREGWQLDSICSLRSPQGSRKGPKYCSLPQLQLPPPNTAACFPPTRSNVCSKLAAAAAATAAAAAAAAAADAVVTSTARPAAPCLLLQSLQHFVPLFPYVQF